VCRIGVLEVGQQRAVRVTCRIQRSCVGHENSKGMHTQGAGGVSRLLRGEGHAGTTWRLIVAEERRERAVGLAAVGTAREGNGPFYGYAVGACAAAVTGVLVGCLHKGVAGGGGEAVGETPVCPAWGGGVGGPPVRGDVVGGRAGGEGDELDVAAVGEEDEGVWWGVSGMEGYLSG
jgi:hypothetical protein